MKKLMKIALLLLWIFFKRTSKFVDILAVFFEYLLKHDDRQQKLKGHVNTMQKRVFIANIFFELRNPCMANEIQAGMAALSRWGELWSTGGKPR